MRKAVYVMMAGLLLVATGAVNADDLSTASVRFDWVEDHSDSLGTQTYTSDPGTSPGQAVTVNALNSDGWGTVDNGWAWTGTDAPGTGGSMDPGEGGVTMFVRYNSANWDNGSAHNTFTVGDGTCGQTPIGAYGIFASTGEDAGEPFFDIGGHDGESYFSENVSLGQMLDENRWYDITGRFDPVAGTISIDVYDPMTGLSVGSASQATSISEIPMETLGNEHAHWVTPCNDSGHSNNGENTVEVSAIWQTSLSNGDVEALSAIPEPATMMLLGLGGLGMLRRKRS